MRWLTFLFLAALGVSVDWDCFPPFASLIVAVLAVCFYFAFFRDPPPNDWR